MKMKTFGLIGSLLLGLQVLPASAGTATYYCENIVPYFSSMVCYVSNGTAIITVENIGTNAFNTFCPGTSACNHYNLASGGMMNVQLFPGQVLYLERVKDFISMFFPERLMARVSVPS